ncbi:hypothetical protein R2325_16870 [Mycobacteroides chelonae]|jgi:hypothetical protein|uniref:hypothetical protein n=1 Tax=Mycobacteroides TaxID=670516 RepID=UPI00092B21F1|nr:MULTISPECIES: hypothetical protein [Mycobacteroides]MBV6360506.1 hypothetical protein [Mycobacteroides chelonae]MEC4857229.1 hypothetical protein [Mycobacteroides chelonae]MEC4871722.1 hypothetical protein [Mycobacteroides chelonae]SHW95045.1 Uncharacterised protein [Mycobacteroides abscessus subsp. abscessus]SKL77913.1 Uncharacterised protein [Mycobacteroides abscessus subsp. abscessus]
MTDAHMADLIGRLEQSITILKGMAKDHPDNGESVRLHYKADGVALALSYAREYS